MMYLWLRIIPPNNYYNIKIVVAYCDCMALYIISEYDELFKTYRTFSWFWYLFFNCIWYEFWWIHS